MSEHGIFNYIVYILTTAAIFLWLLFTGQEGMTLPRPLGHPPDPLLGSRGATKTVVEVAIKMMDLVSWTLTLMFLPPP